MKKEFDLKSLEKIDPTAAAYYKDVARNQIDLSDDEEYHILVQYRNVKTLIHRLILEHPICMAELALMYVELKQNKRSVAKLAKSFNSKKKGHNKKIADKIDKGFKTILAHMGGWEDRWNVKAALEMNLSASVYDKLYERYKETEADTSGIEGLLEQKRQIENTLVKSSLMAACEIANRYSSHVFGIDKKDAIQEATTGILDAIDKYDLNYRTSNDKRVKFITYAYGRAERKVREFIMGNSRLVRLPRSRLDVVFLVIEAFKIPNLQSIEDIVEKANLLRAERKERKLRRDEILNYSSVVEAIELIQNCLHLDHVIPSEGDRPHTLGNMIPDDAPNPEEILASKDGTKELNDTIRDILTFIEYKVIYHRYLDDYEGSKNRPFEEVSNLLYEQGVSKRKLTRARLGQIEAKSLRKLKRKIPEIKELF